MLKRFLVPFIAIMIGQALLFYYTTLWGGTIQEMNNNAFEIFSQKTQNRKGYLQNDMIHRWSNIGQTVGSINQRWDLLLNRYDSPSMLLADNNATDHFIEETAQDIIYMLRKNSVTGAFIILDRPLTDNINQISRPGLYVRDSDPDSSVRDNSDLSIRHGSAALYRKLGITTDILWTPMFRFSNQDPGSGNYFSRSMEAAYSHPSIPADALGCWSPPSHDNPAIVYSIPLVDRTGTVYGVVGIDISMDYLKKMLPSWELNNGKRAAYCLAETSAKSSEFMITVTSGPLLKRYLEPGTSVLIQEDPRDKNNLIIQRTDSTILHADVQFLQLYNRDSPFINERWALLGVAERQDLLSFSARVNSTALLSALVTILVGICFTCIIITLLTHPIRLLITTLRTSDPHHPVALSKVYITEIDELSTAIEDLSRRVSESSSTLSRIINMSDITIGAFELDKLSDIVLCTGQFYSLFNFAASASDGEILSRTEFEARFHSNQLVAEEVLEKGWIVRVNLPHEASRWVKLSLMDEPKRLLGVAVDITEEVLSKRRIEYERDYDLLTSLLNRRAFLSIMGKLLDDPEKLRTSALIMLDLDNLKSINDSFGHDCGDGYLRTAGNAMKKLALPNMVLARMSGDEFFAFIYGFTDQEQAREQISRMKRLISESFFTLPTGELTRVRCSAGVAWYPENSPVLDDLIRYADFAMYTAKNTKKGDFCEFSQESYAQNSYLLHSREDLNKLIEFSLLEYYFQPIISAATGQLFAYEALMRSQLSTLKMPLEILSLARAQSKLYEIERLTWFMALQTVADDADFSGSECKLFINSVSNHILSADDTVNLVARFKPFLHRVVLEVTEEERFDEKLTRQKQTQMHEWGGQVALDDFGTGYNSEMLLLSLTPDYVKIDMSIIRHIDSDLSRQELFKNLVSYCHDRRIKVIAEGVETADEMQTLIGLGTDYLQGYYLGKPQPKMQGANCCIVDEITACASSAGQQA